MQGEEIAQGFIKAFGKRILSLVGYGSYFFDRSDKNSDIDFTLLLDSRRDGDLAKVSKLVGDNIDVTIHFIDEIEQCGWNNFYHGEQGLFFIQHLAQAKVLVGNDIFSRKAPTIDRKKYLESLIGRTKSYIDRVQNGIISSKHDLRFYQKYISRIMTDMLLINSDISFREINSSSLQDLSKVFMVSNIFTLRTKKAFSKLIAGQYNNSGLERLLDSVVYDFYKLLKTEDL